MTTKMLLAMDMDGTVLNTEKQITPRTERAIRAALAAGKTVLFSTGRAPKETEQELAIFPEMRYAIFLSGALVKDLHTGEVLHSFHINFHNVKILLERLKKKPCLPALFAGDLVYAERKFRGHMDEYGCGCFAELYERCTVWVDDLLQTAWEHRDEIYKINYYCANEADSLACAQTYADLPLQCASGIPFNGELSALEVDKGAGLAALCRTLNLPIAQTIAVGDQNNDLAMLRAAGLGVAMGNATREVKAAADAVTDDCDHDGVGKLIEQWLG